MTTAQKLAMRAAAWTPYTLPNFAARYDLSGAAADATYLLNSGNAQLLADRSGNSAVNGLVLNAVNGNYASAPDAAPLRITGDIDLRGYGALPTWTGWVLARRKHRE